MPFLVNKWFKQDLQPAPPLFRWINFNPSIGMGNYMSIKVWDILTYTFLNFNDCTDEV